MRIEAYIQARMGSSRLPGKVLKEVLGKPLLAYLIERVGDSAELSDFVVLTTKQEIDEPIVKFCQDKQIPYFRGSEDNVLDRYYQCAVKRKPDAIVRITADCPLIDPEVIDQACRAFRESIPPVDYVSNSLERTFPRGLDVEVFSLHALKLAHEKGKASEEREHVTPYIYRHPEIFKLKNITHSPSAAEHRWTVDTPEDFELIRRIIEDLYPRNPKFTLKNLLELIARHPDWSKINAHIKQKKLHD